MKLNSTQLITLWNHVFGTDSEPDTAQLNDNFTAVEQALLQFQAEGASARPRPPGTDAVEYVFPSCAALGGVVYPASASLSTAGAGPVGALGASFPFTYTVTATGLYAVECIGTAGYAQGTTFPATDFCSIGLTGGFGAVPNGTVPGILIPEGIGGPAGNFFSFLRTMVMYLPASTALTASLQNLGVTTASSGNDLTINVSRIL